MRLADINFLYYEIFSVLLTPLKAYALSAERRKDWESRDMFNYHKPTGGSILFILSSKDLRG